MQFIILVNWYRIDWFVWLPVILGILFLVMVILRIIRWKTRWGPIQISHVQESIIEFEGDQITCYSYTLPSNGQPNSSDDLKNKVCLYVPPLGVKAEKSDLWATSIAMLGWTVLALDQRHIQKWLCNSMKDKTILQRLIIQHKISHIVMFDYAINLILQGLSINPPVQGKHILLCRPLVAWRDIRSLNSFFPLSAKWRARFHFEKFLKSSQGTMQNNEAEALLGGVSEENKQLLLKKNRFSLIDTQDTWLTKAGQEKWVQWRATHLNKQIELEYKFSRGNWNFYFQETLLAGILARFLQTEE
jgi:hypothetical protein